MPRAVPIISNMTAGELSPWMFGRTDTKYWESGCSELTNFIVRVFGGIRRRPGTFCVTSCADSAYPSRLVPFEFSTEQAYIIELSHHKARFFMNYGVIMSGGSPYEISTPWSGAEVWDLDYCQSADVVYFSHRDYPPYQLTRYAHNDWRLTELKCDNGPFRAVNTDAAVYMQPSANTGSVLITVTGAERVANGTFDSDINGWTDKSDSGCSISWESSGLSLALTSDGVGKARAECAMASLPASTKFRLLVTALAPNIYVSVGTTSLGDEMLSRRVLASGVNQFDFWTDSSGGTAYLTFDYGVLGTADIDDVSVRAYGEFFEAGHVGALLRIKHGENWGHGRITSVLSENQCMVDTIVGFSDVKPSNEWAEGAWSPLRGYPTCTTLYQERLWFAREQTVWGSQINDFTNFSPPGSPITDIDSIAYTIAADDVNVIEWMKSLRDLVLGTRGGVWTVGPSSAASGAVSATNVSVKRVNADGSNGVRPCLAGNAILFVSRSGTSVRELMYSFQTDSYVAPSVSTVSEHLVRNGVSFMAAQMSPDPILWCVLSDGGLAGATYERAQEVVAWHRHVLGGAGVVKSIAVLHETSGDSVWFVVERSVGGVVRRTVEVMRHDIADCFLDCAVSSLDWPLSGPWPHLAGMTGSIVGAGGYDGGDVSFNASGVPLSAVPFDWKYVGLPYVSTMRTLPLNYGAVDGTAQSRAKLAASAIIRLYQSVGGRYGTDGGRLDKIQMRKSGMLMDTAVPPFTGDVAMTTPGGWERNLVLVVEQDRPLPMNVVAVIAKVVTND